ncbi:hypothetical protein MD484_g1492, partial [Candolleomyces efflorescens]
MSSFSTGFWIPSSVQFGTTFLDTGLNLYDSLISTLIVTLFSVFITDLLLVLRCYFIFTDTPWVYSIAALSFVASIAIWIFGLASLGRANALGASSWDWTFSADGDKLPAGFSLSMSMVSSLVVNAIVTVAIVTRVLIARRRLHKQSLSTARAGSDDAYSTAAALLIESALPPVIFGIIGSIFSSESVVARRLAFEFKLIPKVAWLAFTALAPQLILVRILQGRAWNSSETFSVRNGSSGTGANMAPISFSARSGASSPAIQHRKGSSSGTASWEDEEIDLETNKKKVMYQ